MTRLFRSLSDPDLRVLEGEEAMEGAREALDRWYEEKGSPPRDEMFDSLFLGCVERGQVTVAVDSKNQYWLGATWRDE